MADLLECLIQIKGVADTPRRLEARLAPHGRDGRASPRGARVARRLAEAELRFALCLGLMLSADRPALPALPAMACDEAAEPLGDAARWQATFAARRAETVAVLDRCSAEQLGRVGLDPSRGSMTVADLVAVMLAHDTDCLGEVDRR